MKWQYFFWKEKCVMKEICYVIKSTWDFPINNNYKVSLGGLCILKKRLLK